MDQIVARYASTEPPGSPRRFTLHRAALGAIFAAAAVLYLVGIDSAIPLGEHECLVAQTAREMRETGGWIVPHYATQPRIRKTPLAYWAVGGMSFLTGRIDELSARVPSALSALGTLACLYWIARRAFGPRVGLVTAFIGLTALALPAYARQATVEMQHTFWCTASYAFFFEAQRERHRSAGRWWARGFYVLFGLALMAKFPMGGIVVGAPIGVYSLWMLITRRWEVADLWRLRVPEGVVIVLLICAPWPLAVLQRVPDAMQQWDSEYLERYSGELRDVDRGEWWEVFYYLPMLALFVLPWCLSVPEAVAAPFMARYRKHREGLPLLWCWLTVSTLIIGLAAFKRAHYALPSVPALILLLGVVVDDFFFGTRVFRPRRVIGFTAAVAAVLASLGLATMHELREQAPDATVVVLVCGVLALLMVSLAGGCFALRRRLLSFIFVGLVSPAVLIAGWSVFKAMPDDRDAWRRFASAVDEIVPPDEPLRWVGRPSAPAVFYGGGRLVAPRIDDPVHLLKATGGDFPSRVEWMLLSADRIAERLRDPEPIWLVIEAEEFADLRSVMDFPARVAAESHATGDERLLLVTNVFPVPASEPQG